MAIQIGTVDGLITISKDNINCFTNAIYNFMHQGGVDFAVHVGITLGAAFQRYVEPVYTKKTNDFDIASIKTPAYTKQGNEQSPARVTFCRKMGLLDIKDSDQIFQLTPIASELHSNNLTIEEYAFILMTKQGIFKDGIYRQNLFALISQWFEKNATISEIELKSKICELYNDENIVKTRIDIILNALAFCGLIKSVGQGKYVLASIYAAEIFKDFATQIKHITKALRDDDVSYTEYIGSLDYGIFDIISAKNYNIYAHIYPNIHKFIKQRTTKMQQTIYYGAPGTGKSHAIDGIVTEENSIRTTFHPDSDYASFVGCYKPVAKRVDDEKKEITYDFVPQAFTKAYIEAWKDTNKPYYLVIEEINRGNCAQIFGDIFQLLDRGEDGFSSYKITPDTDLQQYLAEQFAEVEISDAEIKKGMKMQLPGNLHILATMNTSDQSLFPIDSAFKRRWEWKYIPIKNEGKNHKIVVDGATYDWYAFMQLVNDRIENVTDSEDKQIGYWFAKADAKGEISAETLVSKVIFYLWNDVFKDYAHSDNSLFHTKNHKYKFREFYKDNGDVNTDKLNEFLKGLDLKDESPQKKEEQPTIEQPVVE